MERNKNVATTVCPKCKATCLVGHDDDGLVLCAKCGHSFRVRDEKYISDDELREMFEKNKKFERGGWIAFTTD